ncbi:PREDICTED: uncharacterized protein LOC105455765 isoform X4 [Wasmannia auropunctata]|uniref:uncharacterized protein LOC105455765 isoform X4 n=1 Tax=Wasmannia auropunctata TaxID=64793 RepID=UPI0005EF713D|nr:PREDICTED: uncharacterized protein LOC105455765 isoform X4 [Wasmannia auropunctata]
MNQINEYLIRSGFINNIIILIIRIMSRKICHRDRELSQILEQVEALSAVVDELRTELNHLKKVSCSVNHENVCFESVNENNKIDYVRPSVLRKVRAYFESIGVSARINETCELTKNNQTLKKKDQEPTRFLAIYGGLKYFKNKIIKNIQNVRKTPQSPKSTKNKCITSSQEQQQEVCFLQKKEQNFLQFRNRNEDTNKYTDISGELGNLADTTFTSDDSVQTDIAICSRQEDDKKKLYSYCNRLARRNIIGNNKQTSPLINNDRSVIYSDRFADEFSKNRVRQTFLKNKIKRYRKCSCGEQCPYALYKLPCNKYRCSTPEKKVDEIGLSLECLSFGEKKDFPKFINVDTVRNDERFTDSSPVEVGMDESLASSLSVELEVDICNDCCDSENVDEFTERRKARTYLVNRTSPRKDDLIKDFRAENETSFNVISSWRNISEKKKEINEVVKKVLFKKRCIYSEENNRGYKKSEDFISRTSTLNFQQKGIQSCQTTGKARYNCVPKIIIPRRKTNIETQTDKLSCLNCLQNRSSALDDCTNGKTAKETGDKEERRKITRKRNICDICAIEMDASIIASNLASNEKI